MPIVSAKCTSCGGEIQLDNTMKTGFCMFCGNKVVVQDAVELKTVQIEGKVAVDGLATLEKLVQNAETFLKLGEFQKSYNGFARISNDYPEDWRGWWGMIKAKTKDFKELVSIDPTLQANPPYRTERGHAMVLAPEEDKARISKQYDLWLAQGIVKYRREEISGQLQQHEGVMSMAHQEIPRLSTLHRKLTTKLIVGLSLLGLGIILCLLLSAGVMFLLIGIALMIVGIVQLTKTESKEGNLSAIKKKLLDWQGRKEQTQRTLTQLKETLSRLVMPV